MEKHLVRFGATSNELEGLDNYISDIPELHQLIEDSSYDLDVIIKAIKNSKYIPKEFKTVITTGFQLLNQTNMAKEVYKYGNFRNQEIIEKLIEEKNEFSRIIKDQVKHIKTTQV